MQWLELKISLESPQADWLVDLIADAFHSQGLKGVVIDDIHKDPLADWGDDALPPAENQGVTGYLPMDQRLETMRLAIETDLATLSKHHGFQYQIHYQPVDEEDWAEAWKAFFHPQKVSDTLVVKPTWRHYAPESDEQVIEIDPGMAFGTGTHPTTMLCLQLMETYLQPCQSVLDIGTGSGILLIAAQKLGAGLLTGVDTDPMAIEVAHKNLIQNRIKPECFTLHLGHLADCISNPYPLVIANILAPVILELLDQIPNVVSPGGCFICSGIIKAQENQVAQKMVQCGLEVVQVLVQEDWVAMVGRMRH
jgi:ribosomal protein L11 methyltransferase